MATVLPATMRKSNEQAALAVKAGWLGLASQAGLVPGRRISNVGPSGASWGVRYDTKGVTNVVTLVRFVGPVHLVFNPTKAHEIRPRSRRGRRALKITGGDDGFARSAKHPGTPGRNVWPAAKVLARETSRAVYRASFGPQLLRKAGFG